MPATKRSSQPVPRLQVEPLMARQPARASRMEQVDDRARVAQSVSDNDLKRHVLVRLSRLGPRVSRNLRTVVRSGEVRLSGTISSDYERQVVLQVIGQINGVRRLADSIVVREEEFEAPARKVELPEIAVNRAVLQRVVTVALVVVVAALGLHFRPWTWFQGPEIVPVAATVRAGGEPAAGALLVLHPLYRTGPKAVRPQGRVGTDGAVEWATFDRGDGVPPGEYVVTAIWNRTIDVDGEMRPGENILPGRFERPETSPLRMCVSADMAEPVCIEMPL